jgi:signal transduction histidine kinase
MRDVMFRQPIQLLRMVGLAVCAVTAYWDVSPPPGWNDWNAFQALSTVVGTHVFETPLELSALLGFAWAFWALTKPSDFFVPSRRKFILMGVQAVVALLLNSSELLYLVSSEIGFVLPNARGLAWVSVHIVTAMGMGFLDSGATGWMYPAVASQWFPEAVGFLAIASIYHLLSFSFGVLGAAETRQRRELEGAQEAQAESARLSERLAIARELHDSLGHSLTGLIVNLQLALKVRNEQHDLYVREAYILSRALLNNLRSAVTNLREIEGIELRSALANMANRVGSPKVSIEVEEGLSVEEPVISHALFRCAQECVTNTIRHAAADKVVIRLIGTPTHYEFQARDDGRGTAAVNAGNGLTGIRERIEELGGLLEIATAPGAGFAVLVKVPRLYQVPV